MEHREEPAAGKTGGCSVCGGGLSRRMALGRISSAALAAMAGVRLVAGGPQMLPVVEAAGADAGPGERKYPVPAADGVTIDRDAQVILVRYQQRVYAFNLACPHENTALRWRAQDGRFQCPRHDSKYRPDGVFLEGRATRNMDRLPVRRVGDSVLVDLNRLLRSDQQAPDWAAAAVVL
jgi:nitrite reductase/ring-hydroxylating ferredoxin subunit